MFVPLRCTNISGKIDFFKYQKLNKDKIMLKQFFSYLIKKPIYLVIVSLFVFIWTSYSFTENSHQMKRRHKKEMKKLLEKQLREKRRLIRLLKKRRALKKRRLRNRRYAKKRKKRSRTVGKRKKRYSKLKLTPKEYLALLGKVMSLLKSGKKQNAEQLVRRYGFKNLKEFLNYSITITIYLKKKDHYRAEKFSNLVMQMLKDENEKKADSTELSKDKTGFRENYTYNNLDNALKTPYQVHKLNLNNQNIAKLPADINKLQNLQEFDLGYNFLIHLPDEISELKNLSKLYLDNNQFQQFPSGLEKLNQLTNLDLSNNKLKTIPAIIAQLNSLEKLDLSFNRLTELPDEIGSLSQLQELYLESNNLQLLPDEIGKLKNLKELYLSFNNLYQLPDAIGNLVKLENLNLSNNHLVQLPDAIKDLSELKKLNLKGNRFTQTEIEKIKSLLPRCEIISD